MTVQEDNTQNYFRIIVPTKEELNKASKEAKAHHIGGSICQICGSFYNHGRKSKFDTCKICKLELVCNLCNVVFALTLNPITVANRKRLLIACLEKEPLPKHYCSVNCRNQDYEQSLLASSLILLKTEEGKELLTEIQKVFAEE